MRRRKLKRGLLAMLAALVVSCALAEVGFRVIAPRAGVSLDKLRYAQRYFLTGVGQYVEHPYVSFTRRHDDRWKASTGMLDQFRLQRTGRPRILCLGGSTTEGGNAKASRGSYPFWLANLALGEKRTAVEVLNGGISGWTSMESMIAYFTDYHEFEPDIVLIHHGVNDVSPHVAPGFVSDYSHWRTTLQRAQLHWWEKPILRVSLLYTYLSRPEEVANSLALATRRPDRSERERHSYALTEEGDRVYRRNLSLIGDHASSRGARVALLTLPYHVFGERGRHFDGIDRNNATMRELAEEKGWILVDLARHFVDAYTEEQREATFLDGVHVRPMGNQAKARFVLESLFAEGVLGTD